MKKIGLLFIVTMLFAIHNSFTQSTPDSLLKSKKISEKHQYIGDRMIDRSPEIIEFLLKYKDNNKVPTQKELNKLLLNLDIKETESNKPISKEVAFKLIDFYFKYSEENQRTNVANFDKENNFLNSFSYINFRDQIKAVNPSATDLEIQKVFIEMHEKLKNL